MDMISNLLSGTVKLIPSYTNTEAETGPIEIRYDLKEIENLVGADGNLSKMKWRSAMPGNKETIIDFGEGGNWGGINSGESERGVEFRKPNQKTEDKFGEARR